MISTECKWHVEWYTKHTKRIAKDSSGELKEAVRRIWKIGGEMKISKKIKHRFLYKIDKIVKWNNKIKIYSKGRNEESS